MKENNDKEEIVLSFSKLQLFVYENLKNGTITRKDVVEMCKHFLSSDLYIEVEKKIVQNEILSIMAEEKGSKVYENLESKTNEKLEK